MLRFACEDEKKHYVSQIKKLIIIGNNISDIAASLGLPRSTVSRYAREIWGASKRGARVKRTVPALAERPLGASPTK